MDWVTEQFVWAAVITGVLGAVAALVVWQTPCRSQQESDRAAAIAMLMLVPLAATSIIACVAQQYWFLPLSLALVFAWYWGEAVIHPARALEYAPAEPLLGCVLLLGIGQSLVLAIFLKWSWLVGYGLLLPLWFALQWQSRRRPEGLRLANTLVYNNTEANELLAFSALYAGLQHWAHDRLDGQITESGSWKKSAAETLAQQWGIDGREALREHLRDYLRPQIISGQKESEVDAELMARETLQRSSKIFICRLAYAAGWIDQITTWAWIRRLAIPLRSHYDSWDAIAEAHARALSTGGRVPKGIRKQQLRRVLLRLRHSEQSPWVRLDWRNSAANTEKPSSAYAGVNVDLARDREAEIVRGNGLAGFKESA